MKKTAITLFFLLQAACTGDKTKCIKEEQR